MLNSSFLVYISFSLTFNQMWLSLLISQIENLSVVCLVTVHLHPDCMSDPGDAGRSGGTGVPQPGEWIKLLMSNMKVDRELLTDMNETNTRCTSH